MPQGDDTAETDYQAELHGARRTPLRELTLLGAPICKDAVP